MRVPLVDLAAQERPILREILAAIEPVAEDARFILGRPVEAFEAWLANACGARAAVGVASGTDAIELALRALGVGAGDAVVTPALSFIATAEAIAAAGARPVFCDVDAETLNAGEGELARAVDEARRDGLRVKAVVPVHLFGRCADARALGRTLAEMLRRGERGEREGSVVVEDAAQALGARDGEGRAAGSLGDAGCFSFFPTKNLGAWGDGGAVVMPFASGVTSGVSSGDDVAARVRRLRAHGVVAPYVHAEIGRNSRLDAIQAAVLLAKTRHLPSWQAARARAASRYRAAMADLPLILPAEPAPPAVHAWHAFVVRCDARDALAAWLGDRGVEARVYYPMPLHRQPCFAGLDAPALPVAEEACRTALALPMFAAITDEQVDYVVEQVAAFFQRR